MKLALPLLFAASLAAQDPAGSRDWMNRGVQAFRQAQYTVAVDAFTHAVQADPSFVPAHLYLGMAYLQMYTPGAGSPENKAMAASAHAEFQKVLEMDSGNRVAMASEAGLYLNERRWDEAQAGYDKLVALNPGNADAWYSMGYIAWSRWYPAYAQARKDAGMKPADAGPFRDPAQRQALKDKWDHVLQDGETSLQKALSINPNNDNAMAYMNLLVRERADLRDTAEEWRADVRAADGWVQKALAAKRAKGQAQGQGGFPAGGGGGGGDRLPRIAPLTKVDPVYPPSAVQARIQDMVRIMVTIGADGRPRNLEVVSGHPLLVPAAIEAVRQWTFPAQGTETRTMVDVPFVLPQ